MPNVGHWAALSKYNGLIEHFDSYGEKPDAPLKWVNLKMRYKLNQATPHLSELLEKQPSIYNAVKFQSEEHKVNTCGSHVAHRLYRLHKDRMSLEAYQDFMLDLKKDTGRSYDYIVADWVKREFN